MITPRHRRPGSTILIACFLINAASVPIFRLLRRPNAPVSDAAPPPLVVVGGAVAVVANVPAEHDEAAVVARNGEHGGTSEAPEPYPYLFGFDLAGNPPQPYSPDPLVRYTWSPKVVNGTTLGTSQLQLYRVDRPDGYRVIPPSCVDGAESLLPTPTNSTGPGPLNPLNLTVRESGSLMLDYGVERAAWIEFTSPDLGDRLGIVEVTASISEFDAPYPGKTRRVKRYGNSTYRLETNDDLYEGVRFAWLHFNFTDDTTGGGSGSRSRPELKSFRITSIALVALAKPTDYVGSFRSSDETLTGSWYTGAYGVRLNMEHDAFNSVLVERGDRVSIQGDGHVTMAAALVAFSPHRLVYDMLNQTNSGRVNGHRVVDQDIMAYPLYWTMSVNDYLMSSGDVDGFATLAPDAMSIIDDRIGDFLNNPDIVWMGWDDRLGNGWCFDHSCNREAHLAFAALVVRACRDLGRSLLLAGMMDEARYYSKTALRLLDELRMVPEWPHGFGLHSASNVINTGLITPEEARAFFLSERSTLNDSVNVCSYSPFNQYWILQALGDVPGECGMEYALASIKLCWGPMLKLGRGCFWEIFSPEWSSHMQEGGLAPGRPSYCHPWSSGVTAWLSKVAGGISPLLPGYGEYVAAPYVSGRYPRVSASVPTSLGGPIAVDASLVVITVPAGSVGLDYGDGVDDAKTSGTAALVNITLESPVPGYVGLYKNIIIPAAGAGGRGGRHQSSSSSFPPPPTPQHNCAIDVGAVLADGETCVVSTAADIAAADSSSARAGDGGGGSDASGRRSVVSAAEALGGHFSPSKASELLFVPMSTTTPGRVVVVEATYRCHDYDDDGRRSRNASSLSLSAIFVAAMQRRRRTSVGGAVEDDAVGSASATTTTTKGGIPHYPPFPLPQYPATNLGLDRQSRGDGLRRHGSDGYVLFGYQANDTSDLVSLPSYVGNVTLRNHGYDGWNTCRRTFVGRCSGDDDGGGDDDVRCASFIPDPRRGPSSSRSSGTRALGVIAQDQDYGNIVTNHRGSPTRGASGVAGVVGNGHDAEASILMDVEVAPSSLSPSSSSFVLSIYCVARHQNSTTEEHAIRAMDLETFNVIAPDGYVSDHGGGVWWSLRYDRSVRLRITSIRGVRVSAVAFAGRGPTATIATVADGVDPEDAQSA